MRGYDDVRGIVIGRVDTRSHYLFFVNKVCLASKDFDTDRDADAWFRLVFPESSRNGFEMRVYK